MGLDTTHGAWSGAYSAFNRWRTAVAKAAGLPPLELMEGFFAPQGGHGHSLPTFYLGNAVNDELVKNSISRIESCLPIRWDCLRPNALHELLYHSDCDGEIAAESCGHIADALEAVLPDMPKGDAGGHIGDWTEKTKQFIAGLRNAAEANEPLEFH